MVVAYLYLFFYSRVHVCVCVWVCVKLGVSVTCFHIIANHWTNHVVRTKNKSNWTCYVSSISIRKSKLNCLILFIAHILVSHIFILFFSAVHIWFVRSFIICCIFIQLRFYFFLFLCMNISFILHLFWGWKKKSDISIVNFS